jgi:3-methyladenine DNA glycosylase AlkC
MLASMGIKAKPSFALKDQLFNAQSLADLSDRIHAAHPEFLKLDFDREVLAKFPELELKERMSWIVSRLDKYLPGDFLEALDILYAALPEPLDPTKTDDDFGRFIWMVPAEFVAKKGCTEKHLQPSLDFLREATKRGSAESAIRPFLLHFQRESLAFVHQCVIDDNYHVRRLASEGTRLFLPWAARANIPVEAILEILDKLHTDNTRYVTRSVANSLNDISKVDANAVVKTLRSWRKRNKQQTSELDWMTKHALRTLLKQDNSGALRLLDYSTNPKFDISEIRVTPSVSVGDKFSWNCKLTSHCEQKLKVTLHIHFLKANGQHSKKVFAVKAGSFSEGAIIEIQKFLPFKPITTRSLYPGTHFAELVVNGVACEKQAFELLA